MGTTFLELVKLLYKVHFMTVIANWHNEWKKYDNEQVKNAAKV